MTPELAQAALHFLASSDLKGGQVNLFVEVCRALQATARPAADPSKQAVVEQNGLTS